MLTHMVGLPAASQRKITQTWSSGAFCPRNFRWEPPSTRQELPQSPLSKDGRRMSSDTHSSPNLLHTRFVSSNLQESCCPPARSPCSLTIPLAFLLHQTQTFAVIILTATSSLFWLLTLLIVWFCVLILNTILPYMTEMERLPFFAYNRFERKTVAKA